MNPSRRAGSRSGVQVLFDPNSEEGQATLAANEAMVAAHASREEQAAQHKARIESHLKSGDVEGAFDYVQTIESDELRNRAFVDFVDRWSLDDPLEAGNWVRDTYGEPFSEDALKTIMRNWSETAPADAAEWASDLNDGQMRLTSLMWGFTVWAESDDYPDAAEWINARPDDPALALPREMISQKLFTVDPAAGVEWANNLSNDEQRGGVLWDFYQRWLESDRPAAKESLEDSESLNAGVKRRLLAGEIRD